MFLWKALCQEGMSMEVRGQDIEQVLKVAHISVPKLTLLSTNVVSYFLNLSQWSPIYHRFLLQVSYILNHILVHEAWKINKLYPAHPQLDIRSYPNGSFHKEKPSRDRLMPLSPNKANYLKPKHPSNKKTQVSGYKIPFVNNPSQLTCNVLVCMYFLSL